MEFNLFAQLYLTVRKLKTSINQDKYFVDM